MKLNFRGANYESGFQQVETIETNIEGNFLGRKYYLRRPVLSTQPQPKLGMRKYRGVSY